MGDRGQYSGTDDTGGAWQCVAYYTFLLFIILHKYRLHFGDACPRNEGPRKRRGVEMIYWRPRISVAHLVVLLPRTNPNTC